MSDIQSMTGFARAEGAADGVRVAWELRSVNGKGLDIRLRLPPGLDRLEISLRRQMQAAFQRGNIQGGLTVALSAASGAARVDAGAFLAAASEVQRLSREAGLPEPDPAAILLIRGVVDTGTDTGDVEREETDALIATTLDAAIRALAQARREEGLALSGIVSGQVNAIEAVVLRAEADPSRSRDRIRERLRQQVEELLDAGSGLDEQRLHQEAALLAAKADVREELDRLVSHVGAARALLAAGGAVGRRLDFLAQEFNREANTLCSKSNASSMTECGLELKTLIDQMREQIQNIE